MAKRAVLTHSKFKKLCRKLGLPEYAVLGVLEAIWHMTAREAPCGDIGKLSNEDIAATIGWDRDDDELIEALISCRWIDTHPTHRLIIHDWKDHADDATKKLIVRTKLEFCVQCPEMSGHIPTDGAKICLPSHSHSLALPEPVPEPQPKPSRKGKTTIASAIGDADKPRPPDASEPFASIERTFRIIAQRLECPEPSPPEVRRHLRESSPARRCIETLGVEQSADLYCWVAKHIPRSMPWSAIWEQHPALLHQMKNGVESLNGKRPYDPKAELNRLNTLMEEENAQSALS